MVRASSSKPDPPKIQACRVICRFVALTRKQRNLATEIGLGLPPPPPVQPVTLKVGNKTSGEVDKLERVSSCTVGDLEDPLLSKVRFVHMTSSYYESRPISSKMHFPLLGEVRCTETYRKDKANQNDDKTRSKIYHDIQADKFCFRRLNATHQVGCSSYRGGAIGTIHVVENEKDIDWMIKRGPSPPYIATLPIQFFTTKYMQILKSSNRVNGVLILNRNDTIPSRFSPDSSCPNENFGLYTDPKNEYSHCKKGSWNVNNPALGMMYEDWNMPIFLVSNDRDIEAIDNCFANFNFSNDTSKPNLLCSAQLNSQMTAAKDTPTCMRRNQFSSPNTVKYCDPLSDQNIVLPLLPQNKSEEYLNRSILVIGTRLDTFSMFDQVSPGAHSVIPGIITLISVAKTLNQFKEDFKNYERIQNIVFMVFNGEAFDYIGSSRVVYDMQKGIFPTTLDPEIENQPAQIKLEHISHFIEISQMVPNKTVWIHTDPITRESNKVDIEEMIKFLTNNTSVSPTFKVAKMSRPLPPASVQQFLKKYANIASLVLADHETDFTNRYYNSLFDNADTLDMSGLAQKLNSISHTLSRMVYSLVTNGKEMPTVGSNEEIIEELLECYVINSSCQVFRQIAGKPASPSLPPYPLYISVSVPKPNAITLFTHHILGNFTGEVVPNRTEEDCVPKDSKDQLYSNFWMSGNETGMCIRTTAILVEALSPAFLIPDLASREYSTWTESVWGESSARVFLQPSLAHNLVTLFLGFLVLILSFLLVYLAEKRASSLFVCRQVAC
ncbi:NCSTN [Cordylochernes scorpioides]|uniref:Nicastrin n=1 Tax=Cordylochernes scorpioides TaxID=51811 RepID=A0ABY6K9C5_9ARAC|nr:NCSTN [Cordylochernes scorpioides]